MSNNCVWRETTACKGFPWEPESQLAQENMKMLHQVYIMCAVHFDVAAEVTRPQSPAVGDALRACWWAGQTPCRQPQPGWEIQFTPDGNSVGPWV